MPIVVSLGKEYIIDNLHMNPLCCIVIRSPLFICSHVNVDLLQ